MRAGLVACTGNRGCKFAASDTKGHGAAIVDYVEPRLELDQPVNIHLTGCPNSCAQHYVGDIGLLGRESRGGRGRATRSRVITSMSAAASAAMPKSRGSIYENVTADETPLHVERLLAAYMKHRASSDETFYAFANRLDVEELKALGGGVRARERPGMSLQAPPIAFFIPENAPFTCRAARLAFGVSRSPGQSRCDRRDPAVIRRSAARCSEKASPPFRWRAMTKRPGTIPPCRSATACSLPRTKPLAPKLMAAMAQQDCGQCGYNCADYANAIFLRKEERLNLCVPGGKDTTRMVKKLAEALNADAPATSPAEAAPAGPRFDRCCKPRQKPRAADDGETSRPPSAQRRRVGEGNLAHRF